MVPHPNLIYYACIAKGTTILAEFNSKDAELGALALKCLDETPPFHSFYSHTVRNRTYTFLIEDPFCYFAIFGENLENSEGMSFLRRVKEAFVGIAGSSSGKKKLETLGSHSFQGEFNPVFHQLLASSEEIELLISPPALSHERNGSSDSSRGGGGGSAGMPLLGDAVKCLKKKRFLLGECGGKGKDEMSEKGSDASDDGVIGMSREFSVVMHKNNGFYSGEMGRQKARKVWKRHVWVVLSMDLVICAILFGVWLWICRGLKCVDG